MLKEFDNWRNNSKSRTISIYERYERMKRVIFQEESDKYNNMIFNFHPNELFRFILNYKNESFFFLRVTSKNLNKCKWRLLN